MIVISNGFDKFFLAPAASELARRGLLSAFSTGAYPTRGLQKWLKAFGLANSRKLSRLIARGEPIPEQLVFSDGMSEALSVFGARLRRWRPTQSAGDRASELSLKWYGMRAQKAVRHAIRSDARLYHYRAGFGHASVRLARRHGLFTLCDHSMAHPAMLEQIVADGGLWPAGAWRSRPSTRVWRDIQDDAEQADAVLVNSDFVKETFLRQGWEASRIHVIYSGIEDAALEAIPDVELPRAGGAGTALRVVFAAGFEQRKGAKVLASAMELLADLGQEFELHMAGSIGRDAKEKWSALRRDTRVHHHGTLSRQELAALLASADVFVFPSLAEGSARVIFEALACGCYVIATPNSGSIVEDRTHGRLIPAGEPQALADAIREAISLGREELRKVGERNARVVREHYRQSQYGDKLVALYSNLLGDSTLSASLEDTSPVGTEGGYPASNVPPGEPVERSSEPNSSDA